MTVTSTPKRRLFVSASHFPKDSFSLHCLERAESIFLCGPAGVGKSHLAQGLGHEAARRGYDVVFIRTSPMIHNLHAGRADGTCERRLAAFHRPEVLILDDFGFKECFE